MPGRFPPLLLVPALFAGCAGPPRPDPHYAQAASNVQLAAASLESPTPATLPLEPQLGGPHPVDFYVQIALERNPEILAARRGVAAEAERIPQVTALEDPMLEDRFWPDPDHSPQTAMGRMPNSLMLSQRFPWLAKLRVRGEVAEQETQIALTGLVQSQLETAEDVHLAYYEVYYYQRAIAITEESGEILRRFIQAVIDRYAADPTLSQQDVFRAQLERDRLQERLIGLRRRLRVAQADLAALLHASPELEPLAASTLDLPPAPEAIDLLYEAAVRCRPELQERLHAIIRDERRRELAALEYYPDVTLGASWDYMTTDQAVAPSADGFDNYGLSVALNLPVWRDRLRAGVREAEHRLVESARRYDAARDDTFRMIRRLIAQADAYERQIRLFRDTIIPRARETLDISISDYSLDKVDVLQVLNNWTELLALRVQLARLEADLGQALASLERVVGCQLAALPATVAPAMLHPPVPPPPNEEPSPDGEAARP